MIKDWSSMNPVLRVSPIPSWTDMVMTRARQPNIIMGTKEFDTKLSESRDLEGDSICTHPRKHKDPYTGSKDSVDAHKIVCWVGKEDGEQTEIELEEMDL